MSTKKIEPAERWSLRRWRQLQDLRRLLIECTNLNAGNNISKRIQMLEKLAEQLLRTDFATLRRSLYDFLEDQAREYFERHPRRRKKEPKGGEA